MTEVRRNWLVTGGSGQVGLALGRIAPQGVQILSPGHADFDLAALPDVDHWLAREQVAAIVNCAAYTAVDRAESEPELAAAINARAPGQLAAAAMRAGVPIIHLSTDYVFGTGSGPWRENDPQSPACVYGRTKAEGEQAVRNSGARHAILRTAWVVGGDGHNFVKTMLRLGQKRDVVRVVADQFGSPTHAGDLADAVVKVTKRMLAAPSQSSGTWHCTNSGFTSWHELAEHVFACAAAHDLPVPVKLEAIDTAQYPTPALRPVDSRLDISAIAREFGIRLRPWQDAVASIVEDLARQERMA